MNKIEELKEQLYLLAFNKTLIMLGTNKMVPWPIEYGFDRAYNELQVYFKDTNKSIHALERLGENKEYYFIVRKNYKTKKMC